MQLTILNIKKIIVFTVLDIYLLDSAEICHESYIIVCAKRVIFKLCYLVFANLLNLGNLKKISGYRLIHLLSSIKLNIFRPIYRK